MQLKKTFSQPHKMTSGGKRLDACSIIQIILILLKVFSGLNLTCNPSEYLTENQCCSMCPAGTQVRSHCTEYRSTSCRPCQDKTFLDNPNREEKCTPCTNCDSGGGLKVKTACTVTSDTVCEPEVGFFCIDSTGVGCAAAQKHRSCKPGQYIRQNGTASTDTECSDCSSGTFSDGTLTSCQPHTQCESLNLNLITAGTASADAQCEGKTVDVIRIGVITACLLLVLLIAILLLLLYFKKKIPCQKQIQTNEENI